jgi:hypothetical protein
VRASRGASVLTAVLTVALTGFALAGCSSNLTARPPAAASAMPKEPVKDSCRLLTDSQIEAATGEAPAASPEQSELGYCTWVLARGQSEVKLFAGPVRNYQLMEKQALYPPVDDVGEGALWDADDWKVYAKQGEYAVSVEYPDHSGDATVARDHEQAAITLAKLALAGLR